MVTVKNGLSASEFRVSFIKFSENPFVHGVSAYRVGPFLYLSHVVSSYYASPCVALLPYLRNVNVLWSKYFISYNRK